MVWWARIGKTVVWLLAWFLCVVILGAITLAIGQESMFEVYRSVIGMAIGGGLFWVIFGRPW